MADGLWSRQGVPLHSSSPSSSAGFLKRPRTDYDNQLPSGLASSRPIHLSRDGDQGGMGIVKDANDIGSAYDRYLQATQASSFSSGEAGNLAGAGLGRPIFGGMSGVQVAESLMMNHSGPIGPDYLQNGQGIRVGVQHPIDLANRPGYEPVSLPPNASNTLYVEGLPPDTTRREVAHIFRPFVGYKEVRLVNKESKNRKNTNVLCFVDFADPVCATNAMSALQGYTLDEHEPDSAYLRIQFSRFPGPRSSAGSRGRR